MSEPAASQAARSRRRAVISVLLLALLASAGGALILVLGQPSAEERRAALQAQEHALLVPRLAPIDAGIDHLVSQAAELATAGRDVLTRTRDLDPDRADVAIATGSQVSASISAWHQDLVRQRTELASDIDPARLSETDRVRIGTVDGAIAAADQLSASWLAVLAAATGPVDLVRAIQTHDATVADAAAAARADDLAGAIASLQVAQRSLVPARAVRDASDRAGADVSTLDDLLSRLDAYDAALQRLYTLLVASHGVVTQEIRAVYEEVEAAQESLPRNQDALKVIVSDIAGPAVTAALVAIEDQRGLLADAVAARPDASGG